MKPNTPELNQDVAVTGLMIALLIGSAFPTSAKWALYLGLFLLFLVWLGTWQNKSLSNLVTSYTQYVHQTGNI